jgi:uncharacterized SAM-binding protein YcdF (DUF218 family)
VIARLAARIWRVFRTASACFVLLLIVLYTSPLIPRLSGWLTGDWGDPKGDVLIVLGGTQLGDGTFGGNSYWRAVYGAQIFREGGFRRMVITGGHGGYPNTISIAQAMANLMVGLGVPREDITLEEESRSTRENALFTARLLNQQAGPGSDWRAARKVLLSSDIHMRRAHAAFERAGLDTSPAPSPDVGKRWGVWTERWNCIGEVGLEWVKYGYYAMRGWL